MGLGTPAGMSDGTLAWMADTPVSYRKKLGQYMTPAVLRERLLDQCDLYDGIRVLDPGVGTGEILKSVLDQQPDAKTFGWDVCPDVLKVATGIVPAACLMERSALEPWPGEQFDLVVGNPPYFQLPADKRLRDYYQHTISGRVNIFGLFFQAGLEVLRTGGQLAYVVPPSMNSGAYFEKLRCYILQHTAVEFLEVYYDAGLFDKARTPVQLIVLRKGASDTGRHVFVKETPEAGFRRTIFTENPARLRELFTGGSVLFDLGYEASTGTVAWNQHRSSLRESANEDTVPLIWSHNIGTDGQLCMTPNRSRPQFITPRATPAEGPAIVTNRIVGHVGSSYLKCAMIPPGMQFLGENHVNVIQPHGRFDRKVGWDELLAQLISDGVSDTVRMITGNTQLSSVELTYMIALSPSSS